VSAPGTVLASGDNDAGQLGISGRSTTTLQPVRGVGGKGVLTGVRGLAGGRRHSLAVRRDGTVVAWGANNAGQLGTGGESPASSPHPTPVIAPDGKPGLLRGAVAVSADSDLSVVLLRDGRVVTFGAGNRGQRGIGRGAAPATPTVVRDPDGDSALDDVVAVSADGSTVLALLAGGGVVAWGDNGDGQLGDGTDDERVLPVHVRGPGGKGRLGNVAAIALGGHHAVAVLKDGGVLAWGANDRGQLGDGTRTPHRYPAPVRGVDGAGSLTGVTQVSAAEKHCLARLHDGRAVGWGFGTAGQLGNGRAADVSTPTMVLEPGGDRPLTQVARVAAGEAYGVALLADATVLDWGAASAGQLGAGTTVARVLPGPVVFRGQALAGVRAMGAGVRHLLLSADP
jgi:alpha-tubulin suppressor-like RCC1 family protein